MDPQIGGNSGLNPVGGDRLLSKATCHSSVKRERPLMITYSLFSEKIFCIITLLKAWSPYSRKDPRTCLRRCFNEDFKVINISIENISCEISKLVTLQRFRDQTISVQLKIHVRNHVFAILTTYMETRL